MTEGFTDVLVVGAGPVGLAVSIGLVQRGVDSIVIDALSVGQSTSRAAVVHAATLDALDALGVSDDLVASGIQVPIFRIREREMALFQVDFTELAASHPFSLMIPQDETEKILNRRLEEFGQQVRRSLRLLSFEQDGSGVRAICETASGQVAIRARFLVGADGERSVVRTSAGIDFPGNTYGSFLLADVRMAWPFQTDEVTLFFSGAGMLVVAPMSRGRYRVVAQLADAPSEPTVQDVQTLLELRGPRSGVQVSELLWGSRFQVHHKLAERFRDGCVILVGDAAHVHSPAGGQGMNLGLRDAVLLSRSLAEALAGREAALDAYATNRRRAAQGVLADTDRLTRLATLRRPGVRWLRNRLIVIAGSFPSLQRAAARVLSGFAER